MCEYPLFIKYLFPQYTVAVIHACHSSFHLRQTKAGFVFHLSTSHSRLLRDVRVTTIKCASVVALSLVVSLMESTQFPVRLLMSIADGGFLLARVPMSYFRRDPILALELFPFWWNGYYYRNGGRFFFVLFLRSRVSRHRHKANE